MDLSNDHIKKISPYKLASHKIWEGLDKDDVLKLDWNEATIKPSPEVRKAIERCIDLIGFRHYPDVNNQRLLNAISEYIGLEASYVQYFASSDSAHEYIARCFLEAKDTVLILGPTYDNFRLACEAMGASVRYHYYSQNFSFDLSAYTSDIEILKPKMAYICNPNNPTGTFISPELIEDLVLEYSGTMFVIDEAYYEFAGESCVSLCKKYDNIIISRTFSKAFALANFRIGYTISNGLNIRTLNKIRNPKNISSFSQEAAIAALLDTQYMQGYVSEVTNARHWLANEILSLRPEIKNVYEGKGNYILLELKDELEKSYFIGALAKNNIFIRDLSHVRNLENFVRITIGTMVQMKKVMDVIIKMYNVK